MVWHLDSAVSFSNSQPRRPAQPKQLHDACSIPGRGFALRIVSDKHLCDSLCLSPRRKVFGFLKPSSLLVGDERAVARSCGCQRSTCMVGSQPITAQPSWFLHPPRTILRFLEFRLFLFDLRNSTTKTLYSREGCITLKRVYWD